MVFRVLLAVVCAIVLEGPANGQVRLGFEEAQKLAVETPNPTYPPLAQQARVEGTVKIEITVSDTGSVISTKLVSGHPILAGAAIEAAKKCVYKPYVVDGKARSFVTMLEIPFSLGTPKKQQDEEQAVNEAYFREDGKCRNLLKEKKWTEAEEVCKAAVPIADRLPEYQGLTKVGAYENAGHALLAQRRFGEALDYYNKALNLASSVLKETDAELGYAYRNVALANHGLGDLNRARDYYGKAEKTLQLAYNNIGIDGLKKRYRQTLKQTFEYHVVAADQAGATAEAEQIRARLKDLQ
jgi:TonB family protein